MRTWLEMGTRIHKAIENLIDAKIVESTREDPDSMGAYLEEQELEEAIKELVEGINAVHLRLI